MNEEYYPILAGLAVGLVFAVAVFGVGKLVTRHRQPTNSRYVKTGKNGEPELPADPFLYGMAMARRQSVRRTGNPTDVLVSFSESAQKPTLGIVKDRSLGGLCVCVKDLEQESLAAVGAILRVRPADAPETLPWVEVEVRRCHRVEDQWEVGCQFVNKPDLAILQRFGYTANRSA